MYRINYVGRPTLITVDEVLYHASTDQKADPRFILSNIIIAEERFIMPALGNSFYEAFIALKNVEVTALNQAALLVTINAALTAEGKSVIVLTDIPVGIYINAIELVTDADYVALWKRFLWKLTAEAVDLMCTVPTWLRHTAQGQQKNNPDVIGGNGQGSATGDRGDVKFKIDNQLQDRIDPLISAMSLYLCGKKIATPAKYPLYDAVCEGANAEDGISLYRKSPIIFGAYDDDPALDCDFGS